MPAGVAEVAAAHRVKRKSIFDQVRLAHQMIPAAAGRALSGARPPSQTKTGAALLPIVNGLWGDSIAARDEVLAIPMSVRCEGKDVSPNAVALRTAFPDATGHLVVFVHGLFETERDWLWDDRTTTYGSRLEHDIDATAVHLRFNSGLRVSENGRLLADLLGDSWTSGRCPSRASPWWVTPWVGLSRAVRPTSRQRSRGPSTWTTS